MLRIKTKTIVIDILGKMSQILENVSTCKHEECLEIIEECYISTIQMKSCLEKELDEENQIVDLLQLLEIQLRELLYGKNDVTKIKEIGSKLVELKNKMEKLNAKHQIVFFPYKASMWDSLESIWKAACEDNRYEVKVVPIPYFDRDEAGNMTKMHWEGNEFPEYVRITRYDEYDLEESKPEIVFIHNPYDEYNIVTSVHPDYYSSRIKNYTNRLVYVPYFILDDMKLSDKALINQKKHYCLTAAVFNSDYVVVQSEDMRQIYINVLCEATGEHTRKKWTDKILGLGSPKVDKVLGTNKENINIPEEWLKVIKKEDGSWKKIVFYNTSLGFYLHYFHFILDKIENALTMFKSLSDEVALIWRPHPLYLSTIEATHPEQKEKYIRMVETYKAGGWGIYDDTPDMHKALALSDMYYGDGSSVARLYEKTGKPVMTQHVRIKWDEEEKNKSIRLGAFAECGAKCYATATEFNGLFLVEENGGVKFLDLFSEDAAFKKNLFSDAVSFDNKILFVPKSAEHIYIYDTVTEEFDVKEFSMYIEDEEYVELDKFLKGEEDDEYIYLIPKTYPVVVSYQKKTGKIEYLKKDSPTTKIGTAESYVSCIHNTMKKAGFEKIDENFYVDKKTRIKRKVRPLQQVGKKIVCSVEDMYFGDNDRDMLLVDMNNYTIEKLCYEIKNIEECKQSLLNHKKWKDYLYESNVCEVKDVISNMKKESPINVGKNIGQTIYETLCL